MTNKKLPTKVLIDSKLVAYTASLQRKVPLTATLDSVEAMLRYMLDEDLIQAGNYEVIFGFDYGKSRYRGELLGSYKAHRTVGIKEKSLSEQQEYDTFQIEYRHILPKMVSALGVRKVGVNNVEYDDLGSILTHAFCRTHNVIQVTNDADFRQLPLELPNTFIFQPMNYHLIGYEKAKELEGATNRLEFLVKKAILGDVGDGILGIAQCGKVCFQTWFEYRKGLGYTREQWETQFIVLGESKEKYKIHDKYLAQGLTSFKEVFDLNLKLGKTMEDTSLFNKVELEEFLVCAKATSMYDQKKLEKVCATLTVFPTNDFGDAVSLPSYPLIRGATDG